MTKIYFYPHKYMRDRQLDTIRMWPSEDVLNPEVAETRKGDQVSEVEALAKKPKRSWKQKIPLVNIKLRPKGIDKDAVVYVWGAIVATGRFIIDIDNPYALTGYKVSALPIYRFFIKRILLSKRCKEIRCLSHACLNSLGELFGQTVFEKAAVHYPKMPVRCSERMKNNKVVRYLYVSTQFDIKGGAALVRAFKAAYKKNNNCTLDMITYVPPSFVNEINSCEGIRVHSPGMPREVIYKEFMNKMDVLIHPTYMDSFGLVVLEALSHGMAIIATDVYAINEMVITDFNGYLLQPPISKWDGTRPREYYNDNAEFLKLIAELDNREFSEQIEDSIRKILMNPELLTKFRKNSIDLMKIKFS